MPATIDQKELRSMVGKKKKISPFLKLLIALIVVLLISGSITTYNFYKMVFKPNVSLKEQETTYIYIPTGSSFEDVTRILDNNGYIINRVSFEWVAELMKYKQNVNPGKYLLISGMNNKELVSLLRSGKQTPVNVIFSNIRTKEQLVSVVTPQIEADSVSLIQLLNDRSYLEKYELTPENVLVLFLPNTYEFYWNTSAEQFMERMYKEYERFWTTELKHKAADINMTPVQVSVLASIVEQETNDNSEKDEIAGVYINRLKKGWKLEADPTLVYALGDFSIRRVLSVYKEIDSPYNTYKYKGLPPGPICLPSIASLKAVLNFTKHNYFFFCAKNDLSGSHCFAKSYSQHLSNARSFQSELNKRKIVR